MEVEKEEINRMNDIQDQQIESNHVRMRSKHESSSSFDNPFL